MKIYIASDHAGFERKQEIIKLFSTLDHEVVDLGPSDDQRCDYPDYADQVCQKLQPPAHDALGILVCGSGQGMAMRANKYLYVRAALCWNSEVARLAKEHNNANILCLGSRVTDEAETQRIINEFLNTEFSGGRHATRLEKVNSPIS